MSMSEGFNWASGVGVGLGALGAIFALATGAGVFAAIGAAALGVGSGVAAAGISAFTKG